MTSAKRQASCRRLHKGFTLVEILIVVIILGILAAIVIPSFTSASTDARNSSLKGQLQTLRSQIEVYKIQHGDQLPDIVGAGWNSMLNPSSYMGHNYIPYLPSVPVNTVNKMSNVVDGTGSAAASASCGFVYDYNSGGGTGHIWATDTDGTTVRAD